MTDAERERAEKWFEDNFVGNACIMCTQMTLKLGLGHSVAVMHERRCAWYISVECTNCGHTLFYNAETIGVFVWGEQIEEPEVCEARVSELAKLKE